MWVRFVDEQAPVDSRTTLERIMDDRGISRVRELPRRRNGLLIPVERPLGDSGATVFFTSDGKVYERRGGVIRRVRGSK